MFIMSAHSTDLANFSLSYLHPTFTIISVLRCESMVFCQDIVHPRRQFIVNQIEPPIMNSNNLLY